MNGWSTFVRQATVLCLLLAVALAVMLLTITHQAAQLQDELGSLQRSIEGERQKMQVLQAEFTFLAEPERLRRLAAAHLGLAPVEPAQLASWTSVDQALRRTQGEEMTVRAPQSGVRTVAAKGGAR